MLLENLDQWQSTAEISTAEVSDSCNPSEMLFAASGCVRLARSVTPGHSGHHRVEARGPRAGSTALHNIWQCLVGWLVVAGGLALVGWWLDGGLHWLVGGWLVACTGWFAVVAGNLALHGTSPS